MDSENTHKVVLGLHFYQPPRLATHPELRTTSTDPEKKDWTAIIKEQCYRPIALEGLLDHVSFDIYATLLTRIKETDPQIASIYEQCMRKNGIGESFIHPILPDLTDTDKEIVIQAGIKQFEATTKTTPKIFWPPETAVDTPTLEILARNGYQGFVCAPEQIIQADGSPSDNTPTVIDLPSGNQLIAYPFDRPISSALAFDAKNNADYFTRSVIKPREKTDPNKVIIAWTDGETFGHHFPNAIPFLKYLVETSLPESGLFPVSINSIDLDKKVLPHGRIVERSAWSCPHGNLIRWNGSCGCAYGQDTAWKSSFNDATSYLNREVSQILTQELGKNYSRIVINNFYRHYSHPETVNSPQKALIAAKISSLIARTSCATFFSDPEVSGKINLLYLYQSLLYLRESGLVKKADELTNTIMMKLQNIRYPNSKETAYTTLQRMLSH